MKLRISLFLLAAFLLFYITPCEATAFSTHTKPLLLNVQINEKSLSNIITVYSEDNKYLWVSLNDLNAMGLNVEILNPIKKEINHQAYVSLNSLPGITYTIETATLDLKITAPPNLFKTQIIDLSTTTEINHQPIRPTTPGMYLTYDGSAQVTQVQGYPTSTSLLTDLGAFNSWGTGDSQFLFQVPSASAAGTFLRLGTQWTQDQPENLVSWRLGDSITSTASWSGAVRFAGIQYATNFATQPNLITFPLPDIKGEATLPSNINLLVNNVLNKSTQVDSGPFIANNIPAVTGAGTVSVVTQDLMGRQQVLNIPYYAAPMLLKPGLSNFSYEAGIMRQNYGSRSMEYAQYLATATYQRGINNILTAGGHVELLGKHQTAGFTASYLWHKTGVISFSGAGSHATARPLGGLISLGFSRQATLSYGIQSTFSSPGFTQLGLSSHQLAPILTNLAYGSYDMKRLGSLSISYTHTKARNLTSNVYSFVAPSSEFFTVSYSKVLWNKVALTAGAVHNLHGNAGNQIFVVFSIGFDKDYSMNIQGSQEPDSLQGSASFAKAVPVGNGYGYSLYTEQGANQQYLASITAQNNYALYNAAFSQLNKQNSYQANIQGSIVHMAHQTHFSRDFTQSGNSFGLVQVPGFGDVKVYSEHQYIGKTNKNGDLVVTNLLPYEQNEITIDPADLPLNTYFSETDKVITPYYRSGVLIKFPTETTHTAIIHLIANNQQYIPEGAMVNIDKSQRNYFTGEEGEVFIQEPNVGIMTGSAAWENKTCHFSFNLLATKKPIPDFGVVPCH